MLGRIKKDAVIATKIKNARKKKKFVFENPLARHLIGSGLALCP